MKSIVVDDKNIKNFIDSKGIVVLEFWAPWCAPCMVMGPTIDTLAKNNKSSKVGKVNVGDSGIAGAAHGISSIPTTVFFKDGGETTRISGVKSLTELQKIIDSIS